MKFVVFRNICLGGKNIKESEKNGYFKLGSWLFERREE